MSVGELIEILKCMPPSALIVVPDDTHWVATLKPEHVQKVMLRPVANGVYSVDALDGHVPGVAIG
jgi:hypothetical protein